MANFRSGLLWAFLSVSLLSLSVGCSGPVTDDQQNSQIEDAQAQIARLKTEISQLEAKEKQSQVEALKKQNQLDRKTGEDQLQLSLLKQENDQLKSETLRLQGRLDEAAVRDRTIAGPPPGPKREVPKDNPTPGGGPNVAQVNLPPEIKEDGSECKDCATPFVGRLTKCVDGKCIQGFISLRVRTNATRSKVPVKFPCPTCMGLGRMPCVSCREADHGFVQEQRKRVGLKIKEDRTTWIKIVGMNRQISAARSGLASAKKDSERRIYAGQISSAEAQISKMNEKRLEIVYAIGEIYNVAFKASLRNIPTSEHPALKRKGAKTIDRFNELFIRGFYH
jgi:outer membrane murein-binding lipoprotein Lpp